MIKHYCDVCGEEINFPDIKNIELYCHIIDIAERQYTVNRGHQDSDGNPTSGRTIKYEFCNKCYNEIAIESAKKIKEIRDKNNG